MKKKERRRLGEREAEIRKETSIGAGREESCGQKIKKKREKKKKTGKKEREVGQKERNKKELGQGENRKEKEEKRNGPSLGLLTF
jgi:hypothetical protein